MTQKPSGNLKLIYLLKMVFFHSFLYVDQRVRLPMDNKYHHYRKAILYLGLSENVGLIFPMK